MAGEENANDVSLDEGHNDDTGNGEKGGDKGNGKAGGDTGGVPDKAEGYTYAHPETAPKITNQKAFDEFLGNVRTFAHSNKLTQEQFNALVGAELGRTQTASKAWTERLSKINTREEALSLLGKDVVGRITKTEQDAAKEELTKNEEALKKDWGENYDARLTQADDFVQKVFDEDFIKLMSEKGFNNHPVFVKALYKLSTLVSEDSLVKGEKHNEPTPKNIDPLTGKHRLVFTSSSKDRPYKD